ncbi:hypothetical protein QYM36_009601 [Artemia franciscana]|uniref:Uncharacterized protein n=1 Tax=Artemia franciscana TaxID=6661 RepID=A0AA88HKW6_ARTSF|nr:hypothetical protein QYM36_009601 [Artemia franciscana]
MDLETSVRQKHSFKQAYIPCLVGLILIVAVPFFHITIFAHLWNKSAFRVDKDLCTCSCWDTVFKGDWATLLLFDRLIIEFWIESNFG